MANANAPFGLRLINDEGKQYRVRRYPKKSGNIIYQGDAVIADATGTVDVAAATGALLGVAMEYKAATDTSNIAVCDDPEAVFEIQASAHLTSSEVFQNANLVVTTGDTALQNSKHAMDSFTYAATSTLQLKVLGLATGPLNAYGSYARARVKINNHVHKAGTTGI